MEARKITHRLFHFALFPLLFALSSSLSAQTYMNVVDNTDISSYSWIVFNPGTYTVPDPGNDGVIRINNKEHIILDGSGVTVDGTTFTGYMIKINNSKNIIIRNFAAVKHFKYAVYITNSDSIEIYNCNFSYNKVDSTGWIDVWADYQQALGGGVMIYHGTNVNIHDNVMNMQNDGVALYHCAHIEVGQNNFDRNTSYGIRMFWTDTCYIHHNQSAHINRPYTNPSDCAAILLIISNENLVEYNDFGYSGDGIFLGQYEHSNIPNNNIFRYNECSYSPHNAIEATFADGNTYLHNICNYSEYGFWLGYSFNTMVDSNEIIGNQYSGIAVDRGFNNTIINNNINDNPNGIELWEGSSISGYENQFSHDYWIMNNLIQGNRLAIKSTATEHMLLLNNKIQYNMDGVQLSGSSTGDTISGNLFRNSTLFHMENISVNDIYATDNIYFAPDEASIDCGIYDQSDNPAKGEVLWHPFGYTDPPAVVSNDQWEDMAEPPAQWYAYPEVCGGYGDTVATNVTWDSTSYKAGAASVKCVTGNGWDIGLQFWPGGDSVVHWQLSESDTLIFWLKTSNTTGYGFQYHQIRVGNLCGGYYKYSGSPNVLNAANGTWKKINVPLAGGGSPYNYVRTAVGTVSLDDISWVSIHADTWDFGFTIWLDGVHFSSFPTGVEDLSANPNDIHIFPNPSDGNFNITTGEPIQGPVNLTIYDLTGKVAFEEKLNDYNATDSQITIELNHLSPGIYMVVMRNDAILKESKLVIR
jgi:parallel beta-helix repeat protein